MVRGASSRTLRSKFYGQNRLHDGSSNDHSQDISSQKKNYRNCPVPAQKRHLILIGEKFNGRETLRETNFRGAFSKGYRDTIILEPSLTPGSWKHLKSI